MQKSVVVIFPRRLEVICFGQVYVCSFLLHATPLQEMCLFLGLFYFRQLDFNLVCNQINLGNQHNNEVYIRLLNSLRERHVGKSFILICAVRLYDLYRRSNPGEEQQKAIGAEE